MSTLIIVTIGLGVYSLAIVPILMELSLDKPKKTREGMLRIKNGFVLKYCYLSNFAEADDYKREPRNICQLYWGIWITLFFCLLMLIPMVMGFGIISTKFILGYLPKGKAFLGPAPFGEFYDDLFHKYQRWGKNNERKWLAPWKVLVVGGPIFLIATYHKTLISAALMGISAMLHWYIYFAVATIVMFVIFIAIYIFNSLRKTESWAAAKTYLKSIKDRTCMRVIVTGNNKDRQ